MKYITKSDVLSDFVLENPQLMPVLTRFGIKPGFGGGTVEDVCDKSEADASMVIEIINTFLHPGYFPQEKLIAISVEKIVEYLKATHNYYISHLLPEIDRLTANLIASDKSGNMPLLEKFYKNYKATLTEHLAEEEDNIFPYALALGQICAGKMKQLPDSLKELSAQKFKDEHSNVENSISDLKNILVKYLPPDYDVNIGIDLLIKLDSLQNDIANHTRIEDFILVPILESLEKCIRDRNK